MNKLDVKAPAGRLHESMPHDSAIKQVAGRADYVDDLTEPEGTLHGYLGLSTRAHAEIASIDLDAVRNAPGVVGVLTADDEESLRRQIDAIRGGDRSPRRPGRLERFRRDLFGEPLHQLPRRLWRKVRRRLAPAADSHTRG